MSGSSGRTSDPPVPFFDGFHRILRWDRTLGGVRFRVGLQVAFLMPVAEPAPAGASLARQRAVQPRLQGRPEDEYGARALRVWESEGGRTA